MNSSDIAMAVLALVFIGAVSCGIQGVRYLDDARILRSPARFVFSLTWFACSACCGAAIFWAVENL